MFAEKGRSIGRGCDAPGGGGSWVWWLGAEGDAGGGGGGCGGGYAGEEWEVGLDRGVGLLRGGEGAGLEVLTELGEEVEGVGAVAAAVVVVMATDARGASLVLEVLLEG